MKKVVFLLLVGIFVLAGTKSYAQYSIKQVDSLISIVRSSPGYKNGIRLGSIIFKASKAINYNEGIWQGLFFCSAEYFNTGRYEESFKYIVEAETSVKKQGNISALVQVSIQKGLICTKLGFYKESKQILNSAISFAKKIPDAEERHYRLGAIYTGLAESYGFSDKNYNTPHLLCLKSYSEYSQIHKNKRYTIGRVLACNNLGFSFLDLKQNDSAKVYFDRAIFFAKHYNHLLPTIYAFSGLGELYYRQHKYAESEANFKKAVKASQEFNNMYALKAGCLGLAKVYNALKDDVKAAKYLKRGVEIGDSLSLVDKAAVKAPLDYIMKNKEQQFSTAKNGYIRTIVVILLSLGLAICIIFLFQMKFKRKLKESNRLSEDLSGQIALIKNAQYTSPEARLEQLKEVAQLAITNDPAFFVKFNEFDPTFAKRLLEKIPNLLAVELEFCALLRLSFETKEIARYTKISVRAVEGKKYRLRKKFGIPANQDISIWMINI